MKNFGLRLFALILLFSGVRGEVLSICTMEYAPVCGQPAVGQPVTYGNKCGMDAAKATFLYTGECGAEVKPVACTREYMPVCGLQQVQCIKAPCDPIKKTYSNTCEMTSENSKLLHQGTCRVEGPVNYQAFNLIDTILANKFVNNTDFGQRLDFVDKVISKINEIMITSLMTPYQSNLYNLVYEGLEIYKVKSIYEAYIAQNLSSIVGQTSTNLKLMGLTWRSFNTVSVEFSNGDAVGTTTIDLVYENGKLTYKASK